MLSQNVTERQQTTVWLPGVRQSGHELGWWAGHPHFSPPSAEMIKYKTSQSYIFTNLSAHLQTPRLSALITGPPVACVRFIVY